MEKKQNDSSVDDLIKKDKIDKDPVLSRLVGLFIKAPLYLIVILLPIFLYPNVPSPLEFNKQSLLIVLIGTSFLSWIGKMAWKNEIRVRKSFLLIPVLTFLLIYTLSTVFSGYYEQSMWGYFGGEDKALATFLFFGAFFLLIYNNIKNYQDLSKLIFSFLFGGFILIIFGILQFFEVYSLPFEFSHIKFFNPIGSIYLYSIYTALVFLVSICLFLSNISKWLKLFLIIIAIGAFFVLMIINFKIVWVILLILISFILGITFLIENKKPSQLRIIPMIFLILTLLLMLRGKPLFGNSELPVEVFLKQGTAMEISLNTIKSSPLLGSGPATFSNVYKKNRPNNLGEFAAVNFEDSSSFFLTLFSTTGILGVMAFLFLILSGLTVLFKRIICIVSEAGSTNNLISYLKVSVIVGWLFLTITLFVYSTNLTILMFWWLFLGLLAVTSFLDKNDKKNIGNSEVIANSDNPKVSFFLSFGFVLIIIGFIAVIYLQGQRYMAAVYFNQALVSNSQGEDIEKIAEKIVKAISLDSNKDSYYRDLATIYLALAKEKIAEKGLQNLTPEESNYISTRFRSALQSLNKAKTLNPTDSLNFVTIANLYSDFITIQKDSAEKAIDNYQKAIELDPKNPEIYQAMANIQIVLSDLETLENNSNKKEGEELEVPQKSLEYLATAEGYLKKALEIKSDHIGSNILLVSVYEKKQDLEKALEKASQNIEIFPNYSELYLELGRLYYQQENYTESEVYLQKALVLNSEYSNARYLLGLVLEKQDRQEKALIEFEKIAESNPENELLIKIISNLKAGRTALSSVDPEIIKEVEKPEIETDNIEESENAGDVSTEDRLDEKIE